MSKSPFQVEMICVAAISPIRMLDLVSSAAEAVLEFIMMVPINDESDSTRGFQGTRRSRADAVESRYRGWYRKPQQASGYHFHCSTARFHSRPRRESQLKIRVKAGAERLFRFSDR
jgi:hypothetical protein